MTRLLALTALLLAVPLAHAQRIPVTTSSDDARVQYMRGMEAFVHNDFPTAQAHLDAAIAADPRFALAHLYRASASANGRQEHMRQATAAGATASEAERQLISTYADQLAGNVDREIATLAALSARYPGDPTPLFIAGNAERIRGNHDQAVALLRRALVADPAFSPAYNLIGYTEMARGDNAAAERAFREYIRLAPDQANPYDSYGEFLLEAGRLDESEAQFQMALTKDPGFTSSRNLLTRIAITRAFESYVAASNGSDPEAYLAHYVPTAVWAGPRGTERTGVEATRAAIGTAFSDPHRDVYETIEIVPMGENFVYHRARYQAYQGEEKVTDGINTLIWTRTPQGWKIARDTWTSSVAPSAD